MIPCLIVKATGGPCHKDQDGVEMNLEDPKSIMKKASDVFGGWTPSHDHIICEFAKGF